MESMENIAALSKEIKKTIITGCYDNYEEINNYLNSIFSEIYKATNADKIRLKLLDLSSAIHEIGDPAIIILLKYLLDNLENVNTPNVLVSTTLEGEVNIEDVSNFLMNDLIENTERNINFFNHKKGRSLIGKKKLYIGLRIVFEHFLKEGGNDDIPSALISMVNMWELSKKNDRLYEFYIYFNSLLHKLNFLGKNQLARDLSELALLLSLKDKVFHYSFYIKMANFARQRNVIDSLLSANMLLYGINLSNKEHDLFLSKILLELFILLRNFQFYPYAERVRDARTRLIVDDEYDLHQFDMAYFNMLLLSRSDELFEIIQCHLEENDVMKFGKNAGIPWLTLLHNLHKLDSEKFKNNNKLIELYTRLLNDEDIKNEPLIKNIFQGLDGDVSQNKEIVKQHIREIQQSRNHQDVNYEITAIRPLVYNLLKNSIINKDIEGALIAHSLMSDTSYLPICKDIFGLGQYPIDILGKDESDSIYDNYMLYLESIIIESDSKQFLWIGCNEYFSYSISLYKGIFSISQNDDFKRNDARNWNENEIAKFAFNDQPSINEVLQSKEEFWLNESTELMEKIPSLIPSIECQKVVIFRDSEISIIPINLLKKNSNTPLCDNHVIITPLSVTEYINDKEGIIDTRKIKLWAPIENSDFAIQMAYSKISDEFTDQEMIKIDSLNPKIELNQDINIFISHGGKDDLYGFRSISTGSGLYITDESLIFGTGEIAILFICHSGSSKASWYSNKINTLIDKVLSMGYKTVIAPAWSYNVMLAGIWSKTFIDAFKNGKDVAESNYIANMAVKDKFVGIGAYAAMHVFGNGKLHANIEH
ncbi:hypothetical protein ACOJ84_003933 [Morganella morganii]|uniref:hypothetical protein n=9 Tax=Morganella morganii TaxID=582 RepID=UPI0009A7B803|nr:hypothetical protein [Morganella morganii]EJG2203084.1 hypothetical protein [Morganella morganii]ELN8408410.1 hypothetical protein [Morganella morganii]MDS0909101.1 hypothetical protein [Morganella morganii]OPL22782.1 hypothetical protein B5S45_18060 [Morganella morganii]RTY19420.1 hypothetical protein EKS23_13470 [Morganella morganii subsp. morganii]